MFQQQVTGKSKNVPSKIENHHKQFCFTQSTIQCTQLSFHIAKKT